MAESSPSVVLRGLGATQRLAESVAAVVRPGDVLGLDGHLGAGKTTFVRFLAEALGVTTSVTSPTFTLANTYVTAQSVPAPPTGVLQPLLIHHIDAYRLESDADAADLALAELLDSSDISSILVVEWAERLTLPSDRLDFHFAYPPEPAATAEAPPSEMAATAEAPPSEMAAVGANQAADDCRIVTITRHGPRWRDFPLFA